MHSMKLVVPAAILAAGFLFCTAPVHGTPEFGKKEKKSCTFCHVKVVKDKADMAKNLNAKGTCYKDNEHSLAKCTSAK